VHIIKYSCIRICIPAHIRNATKGKIPKKLASKAAVLNTVGTFKCEKNMVLLTDTVLQCAGGRAITFTYALYSTGL